MPTSNVVPLRTQNNPIHFAIPAPTHAPAEIEELVALLPEILGHAISCIYADFDSPDDLPVNTHSAVRLLLTTIDRFETAMESIND